MRKLITALSLLLSTSLFAQLSISSTTPSANDLDVSHSSNITINFSENLNVGTVTPSNIRVVGSIHGEYDVFPLSVMNTMNISPQSNYAKGELITVTISTNVFSTTGNTLSNSFSFVVEADDAFYEEGVHG